MSFLNDLSAEDRDLLVKLPYRVGYWISQSDQTGGDESDALEMQALNSIIDGFTRDVFGSESVQYIMMETLEKKAEWASWQDDLDKVAVECADAVKILERSVDPKELSAFKQRLVEIGEAVAVAFREDDEESSQGLLGKIMQTLGQEPRTGDLSVNISASERKALNALEKALMYNEAA